MWEGLEVEKVTVKQIRGKPAPLGRALILYGEVIMLKHFETGSHAPCALAFHSYQRQVLDKVAPIEDIRRTRL